MTTVRGWCAVFEGGPLDALTYRLSPVGPAAPERVLLCDTGSAARILVYGPNMARVPAPVVGEPDQHVYDLAVADPDDPAPDPVALYRYRGPFPKVEAPLADPNTVLFRGPCRINCGALPDDGCLIPTGLEALELREGDDHDLATIARAHGCPNTGCGRLFLISPTPAAAP